MKSILVLIFFVGAVSVSSGQVPQKVLLEFSHLFPKAYNVKWTESEATFSVRFYTQSYIADFEFDQEGRIIKSIRYYNEYQLSPFLIARLNKMYPSFHVINVTEITNSESISYTITLADKNNFYIVQSDASFFITLEQKLKNQGSQSF